MTIDFTEDSPGKMHGIPNFLRADTPEKIAARAQAWVDHPPVPMQFIQDTHERHLDAEALAVQAELDAAEQVKAKVASPKRDYTGLRWDSKIAKWVKQ